MTLMTEYFFQPAFPASLPVLGSDKHYSVNRIFCVGRNYADHAREMGAEVEKDQPFFFTKSPSTIVHSGSEIPYPPGTENLHYEMELVVAIGSSVFEAGVEQSKNAVFGYGCGLDLTRRDLQARFKQKAHPWDLAKSFENSAIISALNTEIEINSLDEKIIELKQNGEIKQHAKLGDMVWRVEELTEFLSHYYHLQPGDLIFTGTPAGVGPIVKGDLLEGSIDGIGDIELRIQS